MKRIMDKPGYTKSVESSPSNGYRNLKFRNLLMTDDPIIPKNVSI